MRSPATRWAARVLLALLAVSPTTLAASVTGPSPTLATLAAASPAGFTELPAPYAVCPGCAGVVSCTPPWDYGRWVVGDPYPPAPFSHADGTPLCRDGMGQIMSPVPTG